MDKKMIWNQQIDILLRFRIEIIDVTSKIFLRISSENFFRETIYLWATEKNLFTLIIFLTNWIVMIIVEWGQQISTENPNQIVILRVPNSILLWIPNSAIQGKHQR